MAQKKQVQEIRKLAISSNLKCGYIKDYFLSILMAMYSTRQLKYPFCHFGCYKVYMLSK